MGYSGKTCRLLSGTEISDTSRSLPSMMSEIVPSTRYSNDSATSRPAFG